MAINIRQTPGFDRSTSGIYERINKTEAENVKQTEVARNVEEGQVVEGTVCENKGQKSIQIQGEEVPVSSEVIKDYEVGETLYLKVDTKEEGKVSLKILSSDEVKQIKAEQIKTESKKAEQTNVDIRQTFSHTSSVNSVVEKSQKEMKSVSKKIETATGEIAKLLKSSKVTVTVSKDVEKAVEKVVNELDVSHVNLLESQAVEVENTDVRTLSNMISKMEQQEQKEVNKEEIMHAVVEKGKELSTFPDGKMYYMISNELELTVNNLYKAEYSYDKDYQNQRLSKEEWEQLKPKVEEYLKKEQIAPNEENMGAAKWLMDHKLPITKANVADVKAMQTISEKGVEEEVLHNNVKHYFELNLDPKEANVFYENEGKVAEKLMEKVQQLNDKDMDAAIEQLVKQEQPLTLDNMLKEVEKQKTAGENTKEAASHEAEKEINSGDEKKQNNVNIGEMKDSDTKEKSKYETTRNTVSDVYIKEEKKTAEKTVNGTGKEIYAAEKKAETLQVSENTIEKQTEIWEASKKVTAKATYVPETLKNITTKEESALEVPKYVTKKEAEILNAEEKVSEKGEEVSKTEKKTTVKTEIPEGGKKADGNIVEISEGKSAADFEQVLDELDSQDINYRKIENQEKREQATKETKEEVLSAKEDVSYEQLGKIHIKRQPKRFSIPDVTKNTEEIKRNSSATVKESEIQKGQPEKVVDKGVEAEKVLSETVENIENEKVFSETVPDKADETSKSISENETKKENTYSEKETEKTEIGKEEGTVSEKTEAGIEYKEAENKKVPVHESKREEKATSDDESKKEEKVFSVNETPRESSANEAKREESTKETLSKEQSELLFGTMGGVGDVSEIASKENKAEKKDSDFHGTSVKDIKENAQVRSEDSNQESNHNFERTFKEESVRNDSASMTQESKGDVEGISKKDTVNTDSVKETRKEADVSERTKETSKGQNKEMPSSLNGAELEAKIITAKRQLEEIRLKLTLSSAKLLAKNDIKIDTKELSEIVDQLKELEKEACRRQLIENRIEPTEENIEQFRITTKMAEELKEMPSYSVAKFVREPIPMTMEGLHEEGRKLKADFDAANERYETMMTKPRSDMGDSINKAFRNVDDILKEMDLEVTEANQRAVRILGYNSMEITEENLEAVKAKDLSVNRLLNQLTPQTVMEFIRNGENIIKIPVEELNLKIEAMNNEAQEKEVARYSEFLYKLEKNKEITPEERTAFVGVYRLLDKVVKSKGRDIGALVKSGQEITLKNLLTAQRTIKASKIDANIDDEFGMVTEVIEKGVKITEQIEQGFTNGSKHSVSDSFLQEGVQNSVLAGVGTQNADSSVLGQEGQIGLEAIKQEAEKTQETVQQEEILQQVEKEQKVEEDSLMKQTISYQQDLAKEILKYINPGDLKALSKVFGENLEHMTFEQIKDRLSRTSGRNVDVAFTGEPVLEEYQEEQMKEWKQLAQTEQKVMKALSDFDVSKTLSNAKAFETIFSKETPLFEQIKKEFEPKTKKDEKEKKIQKSISSLGGFFAGKEEAVRAYDDFAEELMDESGQEETLTTKDILARKNLMLAGNLMAKMAREESFIVPVQIQNKDTTMEVTLKSNGTGKGTIQASVVAGNWGEITAELLVEEGKVSVYSKAESKEGEAALNKALSVLEGTLSANHITLQQTRQPIQGTGDASTKQLYQVAKSFVEAFRA
ncbi:MAG: hypothetical protein IJA10_14890 [Lachnospiraceae bacterium]|nr:hypothetical protein [Lachnospiraceae bacterium]